MLKGLFLSIFLIYFLTTIDAKKCPSKKQIVSISSGTSFGMCMGYCQRSINITSNPYKLLAIKQANYAQQEYPTVQQENPFSSQQWNKLINLVNLNKFQSLAETLGCPDCADGGAEWIQIDCLDFTKKVTFEYGKTIEGLESFIKQLRQLREQYVNNP